MADIDIKFPTMDEFAKEVAEKALDEFLYDGKSIREWIQIIASEDVISRQAVINLIRRCNSALEEPRIFDCHNAGVKFEQYITELPLNRPQEPKTGYWIPVSERLPKTDDDVLVYDGVDMFVAWYSLEGMWQGWNSCDDNFDRDTPIIAWMPLPVPYKPESEEK